MVVDEFGEGLPVGFMISNREDEPVLRLFFKEIKKRVDNIEPNFFMTDDAPQYFNAWEKVFGHCQRTTKLLCRWHIDKNWRKALREMVQPKELQVQVYHHLMVLMEERSEVEFYKLLTHFLTYLSDEGLTSFLEYFQRHYCSRTMQWATYGRCYTTVNTNMNLEAFHRLLKVVYLHQKKNRRVDTIIHVLLQISRDKAFERLTKLEKGKNSHRIGEINRRHRNAESMDIGCVQMISPNVWKVKAQSQGDSYYAVNRLMLESTCSCKLKCAHCGACIHMYSCTCIDNILHSTVCKHIHFVHMSSTSSQIRLPQSANSEQLSDSDCLDTPQLQKRRTFDCTLPVESTETPGPCDLEYFQTCLTMILKLLCR